MIPLDRDEAGHGRVRLRNLGPRLYIAKIIDSVRLGNEGYDTITMVVVRYSIRQDSSYDMKGYMHKTGDAPERELRENNGQCEKLKCRGWW